MAKAQKKLVLTQPRIIPLDKLERSEANVRKVKKGLTLEALAEDIENRGLLENLGARPIYDESGNETDRFHVTYGGRRLEALLLLVQRKRLAKDAPIPCMVRTEGFAEEDSLQENELRLGLHPLDQFRAFERLAELKFTDEEIAARHFVPLHVVHQRRRLARISPKLLAIYEEDAMTLRELEAFTLTEDHARQEAVWESVADRYEPDQAVRVIRRALTEISIRAADRRVKFIGLDAYLTAGGYLRRDLFEQDEGGWLEDVGLVDRLVAEKLKAAAETVAAEGWKWVEAAVDLDYGYEAEFRQIDGAETPLTPEQQARCEELEADIAVLSRDYGIINRAPAEAQARWREFGRELDALLDLPLVYDPAEIAIAGAFVSIDHAGNLSIDRGFIREEDEPAGEEEALEGAAADPVEPAEDPGTPLVQRAVITIGGEPAAPAPEEPGEVEAVRPLSDTLVIELTAVRTVALQNAVANDPRVAMTVLLHKLCLDAARAFGHATNCLEASITETRFVVQNPELKHMAAALAMKERRDAWKTRIPDDEDALWDYLAALDDSARAELLAHLVSLGVTAVDERPKYDNGRTSPEIMRRRIRNADRVAQAVGLDMVAEGWHPTADNYLDRVTKPRILDAVREALGESQAQLIAHLKKGDMAREAERLLAGTGWLPELLRLELPAQEEGQGEASLPEFLDGPAAEAEQDLHAGDDEFLAAAE